MDWDPTFVTPDGKEIDTSVDYKYNPPDLGESKEESKEDSESDPWSFTGIGKNDVTVDIESESIPEDQCRICGEQFLDEEQSANCEWSHKKSTAEEYHMEVIEGRWDGPLS